MIYCYDLQCINVVKNLLFERSVFFLIAISSTIKGNFLISINLNDKKWKEYKNQ